MLHVKSFKAGQEDELNKLIEEKGITSQNVKVTNDGSIVVMYSDNQPLTKAEKLAILSATIRKGQQERLNIELALLFWRAAAITAKGKDEQEVNVQISKSNSELEDTERTIRNAEELMKKVVEGKA